MQNVRGDVSESVSWEVITERSLNEERKSIEPEQTADPWGLCSASDQVTFPHPSQSNELTRTGSAMAALSCAHSSFLQTSSFGECLWQLSLPFIRRLWRSQWHHHKKAACEAQGQGDGNMGSYFLPLLAKKQNLWVDGTQQCGEIRRRFPGSFPENVY